MTETRIVRREDFIPPVQDSSIKFVGVLGAGLMGSGIAQVFAQSGWPVMLHDVSGEQMRKAVTVIRNSLERGARSGAVEPGSIPSIIDRIALTGKFADLSACDFVIEAVNENEELKIEMFRRLDDTLSSQAILATNTSSISITRIAGATRSPDRVIGMHFMNPVAVMNLVELIRGLATSEATFQIAFDLVTRLGKKAVVSQDYPGFIVNRILIPMINEAIFVLQDRVAEARDIDEGMKIGTNQPMGPLELADLIGLDTVLSICNVLYEGFKDPKYRPSPLLVRMVNAGLLGRKSGRGFYTYGTNRT
jgi:3-hydroxybutyryl-CoA dehydrogenase